MNRRNVIGMLPVAVVAAALPKAASSVEAAEDSTNPTPYPQWTGYHWAYIKNGVITSVLNDDVWFELDVETIENNIAQHNNPTYAS